MRHSLLVLPLLLLLSGCSRLTRSQPTHAPTELSLETDKPVTECVTDDDCTTPMEFLIQSNCPFGSACIEGSCEVVCPLTYHAPAEGESLPFVCEEDSDCSCDNRGERSSACVCHQGACLSVETDSVAPIDRPTDTDAEQLLEPTPPELSRPAHPILDQIVLPEGFYIDIFAEVPNARSLEVVEEDGRRVVFVGNRQGDKVYAVIDELADGYADEVITLASRLDMPNGVAYHDGDLYVAEKNKIHRFENILDSLENPVSTVVYDDLPRDNSHGWKYVQFGPDGRLYVPIGAPCNICDAGDPYATITAIDLETSEREIIARGIRNTVGFDRHPETGELWFTDNGRDRMGDDIPTDELNRISASDTNRHFGYPFCHQGDVPDPSFATRSCDEFIPPVVNLGPHVAALGMEFYQGEMFPDDYEGKIFIAEHGSRNRSVATGYRLSLVDPDNPIYTTFAHGRNQQGKTLGRPVDVEVLSDGSMLVSDDDAGLIYRITYYE